jgi:predicted DNA-binding transcriptional regulator AlpA
MTYQEIDPGLRQLADQIGQAMADALFLKLRHAEAPVPAEYLTARQVGLMTGFTAKSLEAMRARREGPPYFKVGNSVRYRVADVRAWIEKGGVDE